MLDSLLDRLARQCGIGDAYLNYRGDPMIISQASRKAILAAMGRPTEDAAEIERVLSEIESEKWFALLPPVAVVRPGARASRSPWGRTHWSVDCTGASRSKVAASCAAACGRATSPKAKPSSSATSGARVACSCCRTTFRTDTTHCVSTSKVATRAECALIAAPPASFEPQVLRDGQRLWGVAVQLYTLRSGRNWGIGDFADLEDVVRGCAPAGASFIGLNPLHALFPCNPGTSARTARRRDTS